MASRRSNTGAWDSSPETLANANAGGHPGATIFASNCGCPFYQPAYPFAIGPRLGVAYQIDPKTVFRGGMGSDLRAHSECGWSVCKYEWHLCPNAWHQLIRKRNGAGFHRATGLARYESQPVSCDSWRRRDGADLARPAGKPPASRQPMERRYPARDHAKFCDRSGLAGNTAAWLSGFLGGGTINHIPASAYAALGLYPYPGTGPAGYNFAPAGLSCTPGNDCARALLSQSLPAARSVI